MQQLRENPSVANIAPNHHAALKRKPPVHKQNRKHVDLYNPADLQQSSQMLPNVVSNNDLRRNPNNMAYVNISSDGAKPVGPIGLKRAEKELIMRRYKYNHH